MISLTGRFTITHLITGALASVLIVFSAGAQEDVRVLEDVDPLFRQGVEAYSAGEYRDATSRFDRIINGFPLNHRTTAAYVMKAKAELASGDALDAARTARTFLSTYPSSSYRADAEYTLGLAFMRANRFESATITLLDAWRHVDRSGNRKLERDIVGALDSIIDSTYNTARLNDLIGETETATQRAFLWLKIAEKYVDDARIRPAETVLDTLDRYYPAAPFPTRIAAVRERTRQRGMVKVGVLLPLMKWTPNSPAREIGEEILEGIQFAADRHNGNPAERVRVVLDVRDTQRDPLVATRIAQELTSDDEVLVILGPIFSNTTAAVVGLANARGVPLVTPTANSNGIAAVGPYIFQANPDYEIRGRAMARYAINRKGHQRFAVLAPIDTYSKYLAESFIDEALVLGAEVIATEWYQRGETDFSMQLKNIRKIGMHELGPPMISFSGAMTRQEMAALVHLGVPMHRIDSLLERSAIVDAEQLLGPAAGELLDSMGVARLLEDPRLDSLEYPVQGIDGFYVPVSMPEEIGAVSSQIVYFNFESELLGSGEWNNFTELDANKRYCTGVEFDSDRYVNSDSPRYGSLVDSFFEKHKKRPTENTLFGYDSADLILEQIRSGATHRATFVKGLGRADAFEGFHSRIGFSPGRVNTWIHILRFDGERIQHVEELSVR